MPIAAVFAPLEPLVEAPLWVLFVTPGVATPIIALAIGGLIKKSLREVNVRTRGRGFKYRDALPDTGWLSRGL